LKHKKLLIFVVILVLSSILYIGLQKRNTEQANNAVGDLAKTESNNLNVPERLTKSPSTTSGKDKLIGDPNHSREKDPQTNGVNPDEKIAHYVNAKKMIDEGKTPNILKKESSKKFYRDEKLVTRQRFVELNEFFSELELGESYTLNLFDDTVYDFTVTKRRETGKDNKFFAIGKIANKPKSSVTIVHHPNRVVAASIQVPSESASYVITFVGDDVHRISQDDFTEMRKRVPFQYERKKEN